MKRKKCVAFLVTGKNCEGWAVGKTQYCPKHQHLARSAQKVKISQYVTSELPSGENGFLFDSNSGNIYSLNRIGAFVVRQFSQGKTIAQTAEALSRDFEVGTEEALTDVLTFATQMEEMGVGSAHD